MKYKNKQKGFTLIELTVIMGILVLCGGLIASIIFNTLRGSKKSTSTNSVTQNGNFALSTISDIVNKSDQVVSSCTNVPQKTLILYSSETDTVYSISCASGTNITVSQVNRTSGVSISPPTTLLSSSVKLVQDSCSLKCSQTTPNVTGTASANPFIKPLIEVSFVLTDPDSSGVADIQSNFKTSVLMRSYMP